MTDFLKEGATYEILNEWLNWLPITKSALYVHQEANQQPGLTSWGLAVPESLLKRYSIPVNEAVTKVDFGKTFVFHFCGVPEAFGSHSIITGEHPALQQLAELGLRPAGDFLLLSEMRLSSPSGEARERIGRCLIPITKK